jgi:hypothetical protein
MNNQAKPAGNAENLLTHWACIRINENLSHVPYFSATAHHHRYLSGGKQSHDTRSARCLDDHRFW